MFTRFLDAFLAGLRLAALGGAKGLATLGAAEGLEGRYEPLII